MKKALRKFLKRIIKVEYRKVYCIEKKEELQAEYYSIFGIHCGVNYTQLRESIIGI
jgi:hypothetical protein